MKRLSLLLSTCAIAATSHAQMASPSVVKNPISGNLDYSAVKSAKMQLRADKHAATANKTTAATSRWYSYVDYFDTSEHDNSSKIGFTAPYLWKDSMSVDAYSDGSGGTVYEHNTLISVGHLLDPTYAGFNNYNYYVDQMKVTPTNSYSVDSLRIWGVYGHNNTKLDIKDTLRITIMVGSGAATGSDIYSAYTKSATLLTRYGVSDSMKYYNIRFDSATNDAKSFAPGTAFVKDVILDTSVWGDTFSNGTWINQVGFAPISVPAGSMVSASIKFISGDASFVAHDTVWKSGGSYKYNMLRPLVAFKATGTPATPVFPTYSATNRNTGVFKSLPSDGFYAYSPLWFWSGGSGAASYQYPNIDFHLTCTSCGVVYDPTSVKNVTAINKVNAYPDPTADELNITFNSSVNGTANVSLTNIVGQTVKTQTVNAVNGQMSKVTFNTSDLANGVYFYNVKVDGQSSTGRVVVSH